MTARRAMALAALIPFLFAMDIVVKPPPGFAQAGRPPWKSEVCGARRTCRIAKTTPAGRSASGAPLVVAEVRFGIADKPEGAPDQGCTVEDGENDGGAEYWLIEDKTVRRLLSSCNGSYGTAGGEDAVEISDNRFSSSSTGGSAQRFEEHRTVQLSPLRVLSFSQSLFRAAADPSFRRDSNTDVPTMTTRETVSFGDDQESAFALPMPKLETAIPPSTPLGDCAMRVGPDNLGDFLTFGKLDPRRRPELRLLAVTGSELVVQIYDPAPAPQGQSWVHSDHIEIWTADESGKEDGVRADPAKVSQIGIPLKDAHAYAGVGRPQLPQVAAFAAADEPGRSVTVLDMRWPATILDRGVAVVYSQAENGRQVRLFATTEIDRNRPVHLPEPAGLPVTCGVRHGRLTSVGFTIPDP